MSKGFAIVIGVLVVCIVIIASAPASLIVGQVRDDIHAAVPALSLGDTTGSVWEGQIDLKYGEFPAVTANWSLNVLPLLTGTAAVDVKLAGRGIRADAWGSFDGTSGQLVAPFIQVNSDFINQVTEDRGLSLSGTFTATEVNATFDQSFFQQLSGLIDWPGGLVYIQTPAETYSSQLPALKGALASAPDQISLLVTDQHRKLVLIEIQRSGWASVDVTYDFMKIAGVPIPGADNHNGQASAILIEEKIL